MRVEINHRRQIWDILVHFRTPSKLHFEYMHLEMIHWRQIWDILLRIQKLV